MSKLEAYLESRKDELGGDVFDILLSMSDFEEFKDLMVAQKLAKVKKPVDLILSGQGV